MKTTDSPVNRHVNEVHLQSNSNQNQTPYNVYATSNSASNPIPPNPSYPTAPTCPPYPLAIDKDPSGFTTPPPSYENAIRS